MSQPIRFVGLDVHAESISVAVAEEGRDEARFVGRYPNDLARLLKTLDRLGDRSRLRCAYEAGPTGYGLQRALTAAGIECVVIAPSKTPRGSGDRVKTDRRDATRLAHFLRSGDLVEIHMPDEACEAMRDLIRAREDAKRAQLRARHQLLKFLLRHGRRWPKSNWTIRHLEWIAKQRFEHEAHDFADRAHRALRPPPGRAGRGDRARQADRRSAGLPRHPAAHRGIDRLRAR